MGKSNPKITGKKLGASQTASNSRTKKNHTKSSKLVKIKARESIFKDSPIYDLLRTFERAPNQWAARYIIILTAIIFKSAIGLGSFSGEGDNPINGDFEAQRHWMELTINLPIDKWYYFDLEYWGLDYPPLTAFHSYVLGKIGSLINSSWFELNESRGLELPGLKNFMRNSSLISEMIIYVPGLLTVISVLGKRLNLNRMDQIIYSSIILYLPSLNLIDHGHFQFNSVMLGLFLLSLIELVKDNLISSSIWFILSINFKQMGLYYSPFIFMYILSKLFDNNKSIKEVLLSFNISKFILISLTIIITQFLILLPFLIDSSKSGFDKLKYLQQILTRVFPFQRGLFEDKVSNFWCISNIFIKYKQRFALPILTRISLLVTLLSLLPSNLILFYKNFNSSNDQLISILYGFAATSWSFYLFSFQVHEKSVLVPLLPSTLLYLLNDEYHISIVQWINNVAVFSLYPLLKKDRLILQYFISTLLSNWLIGGCNIRNNLLFRSRSLFWKIIVTLTYISMAVYHFIDYYYLPPIRYPDLFVILNATISFGCFSLFWLWLLYRIYKL